MYYSAKIAQHIGMHTQTHTKCQYPHNVQQASQLDNGQAGCDKVTSFLSTKHHFTFTPSTTCWLISELEKVWPYLVELFVAFLREKAPPPVIVW